MAGFNFFLKFLKDEGLKVNEEDSHFSFKYQGVLYYAAKDDSPFLQITLTCNTRGIPRSRLLEVCNEMNGAKFVIKFVVMDEKVWCNYEFMPTEHTTCDEFMRALDILDKASDEMLEKLR